MYVSTADLFVYSLWSEINKMRTKAWTVSEIKYFEDRVQLLAMNSVSFPLHKAENTVILIE